MIRIGAGDVTPRDCEQCKRPFVPMKGSAGRFCSRQCSGAYRTAHLERVPCDQCGEIIRHQIVRSEGYRNFFCGQPCLQKFRTENRMTLEERFWKHVDKSGDPAGCWLWTAFIDDKGYGRLTYRTDGKMVMHIVPRLSWELHNGPIPDGLWVLHNCPGGDDPACCRPSHLFLGTNLDNQLDCVAKGRKPRGEQHVYAKLAEWQVIDIRRRYAEGGVTHGALATEYGVTRQAIGDIILRRRWKHIP